jgi:ribosomal protein S18 acetylase RimI-like enzyme
MSTKPSLKKCSIIHADLELETHRKAVVTLINDYRCDPMGGFLSPQTRNEKAEALSLLRKHPTCRIFLAGIDRQFVGMLISFVNLSTFMARPLLNVHDVFVKARFRRMGIGRRLFTEAETFARSIGCCRMTLEVRTDNAHAQKLYRSIGFAPCDPPMEFWRNEW